MKDTTSRRSFLQSVGFGAAALGLPATGLSQEKLIQGFEETPADPDASKGWRPVSERKIRVGIVGYGVCRFGAAFGFQDHPNVEIVAVSDLIPEKCKELAEVVRCPKTYPSLEELIKDDSIEAVFVATDAPSHARHCMDVLAHGKHVATAVPAVWGSLEDAEKLFEAVKASDRKYMMFETSYYHAACHAMREIYKGGGFGKLVYSEGEYYHYCPTPIASYKNWRVGAPTQWYPTHSNAYYVGVTGGSFTEVSCIAMPSILPDFQPGANVYGNLFDSEIALFRTDKGAAARMAVAWGTAGAGTESGSVRGERGAYIGNEYHGLEEDLPDLRKPSLPPGVESGGHGGSHGYLGHEFVMSILEERPPAIDLIMSLNMTVPGIIAHRSACRDGELLDIPQYSRA